MIQKLLINVPAAFGESNICFAVIAIPDEEKRKQETASLNGIGDSFRRIVVVRDDIIPRHDDNGIPTSASKNSCSMRMRWGDKDHMTNKMAVPEIEFVSRNSLFVLYKH